LALVSVLLLPALPPERGGPPAAFASVRSRRRWTVAGRWSRRVPGPPGCWPPGRRRWPSVR